MEEEKAAAYYDELTRKGEGAARFKQGLGFTSGADVVPARGSAIASSSFLNQFVKASSNPNSTEKLKNNSDIRSIRDKLKKKPEDQQQARVSDRSYRDSSERRRYRSRERDERDKSRRKRSRSRSTERRSRYGDKETRRRRSRSRSSSPRRERRRNDDDRRGRRREEVKEHPNRKRLDYSRLIKGYDEMSAAEKVKAKMKLQLDETAEKDTSKGAGWERFEFDKDAPVDDEEVEEGADDDAALVKRMGQSFRFSAIEAKREEQVKAAHDEAMFGAPIHQSVTDNSDHDNVTETTNVNDDGGESNNGGTSLLSDKVLAKQQGSWRDRARKS